MTPRRVVLVGASGAFGSRLATLLARQSGIELILTARHREPLEDLATRIRSDGTASKISTAEFDRTRPDEIGNLAPWLVVDAAGPFQASDYGLSLATIAVGAHYIDLADARHFVADFPGTLDTKARAGNALAVTGASSTPALSHAALARLTNNMKGLDDIVVAITPGARAPMGLSVVQAILSYAGKPVRIFRGGRWTDAPGWSGAHKLDIPSLGKRWVSLCETPDLDLLPANFPVQRSAIFLAGLELAPMHLGLSLLSRLVRWNWLRTLRPFAVLLRRLAQWLQVFGSDRGGMIVQVSGRDQAGRAMTARWTLLAEANAGPNVPAATAAALTRAILERRITTTGAMPCVGLLSVEDILAPLSNLPIAAHSVWSWPDDPALFRRLIGPSMDELPQPVRIVHEGMAAAEFTGQAMARTSQHPVARLIMRMAGLPRQGRHLMSVRIDPDATGETWTRQFSDSRFQSHLSHTSTPGLFEESFGPIRFAFEMLPDRQGISWHFRRWRLFGLALPLWTAPRIRARSGHLGDRYRVSVVVAHRWLGLLFAYRGTLDTERSAFTPSTPPLVPPPDR